MRHSPNGSPIAAANGASQVHLLSDRHGDVAGSFTAAGIVDSISFDPFGEVLARNGSTSLMVGFQGQYTDPTTALVDMGARWYRPSTGSFLSRDSYAGIADTPVSLNRYTYANNDPLSMFDPDGHCAIKIDGNFCAGSLPKSKPKPPTPRNPGYHGSADSMERQANTNPRTNPGRSGSADGAARNAEIQEEKRRDLAVQRTVDAVAAAIERVIGSLDTALANYLGFGVTPSGSNVPSGFNIPSGSEPGCGTTQYSATSCGEAHAYAEAVASYNQAVGQDEAIRCPMDSCGRQTGGRWWDPSTMNNITSMESRYIGGCSGFTNCVTAPTVIIAVHFALIGADHFRTRGRNRHEIVFAVPRPSVGLPSPDPVRRLPTPEMTSRTVHPLVPADTGASLTTLWPSAWDPVLPQTPDRVDSATSAGSSRRQEVTRQAGESSLRPARSTRTILGGSCNRAS